jgi:hypothetical protein
MITTMMTMMMTTTTDLQKLLCVGFLQGKHDGRLDLEASILDRHDDLASQTWNQITANKENPLQYWQFDN